MSFDVIRMVIAVFSLFLSLSALFLAVRALRASNINLKRSIENVELAMSDLDERHSSLLKSHKKLNSRVAMRQRCVQVVGRDTTETNHDPNISKVSITESATSSLGN